MAIRPRNPSTISGHSGRRVSGRDPVAILQGLEDRVLQLGELRLPEQQEAQGLWSSIAFVLGGVPLVVSMDGIGEIATPPEVTRVPGAKHWVRGIANVRGNLLPVLHLMALLRGNEVDASKGAAMLVVSVGDLEAGLVVDEVLGMRHYPDDQRSDTPMPVDDWLSPYITGAVGGSREKRAVFDVSRLLETPEFMDAAA